MTTVRAAQAGPVAKTAPRLPHRFIAGMRVDATSYGHAAQQVVAWAQQQASRYVCVANVHMVIEGVDAPDFRRLVNEADLVTPDGVPLVWMLRLLKIPSATRVYGPTLTLHVCEAAAEAGVPIALYGGTPESLAAFRAFLERRFPGVEVACAIAPPFRSLTPEEDAAYVRQINASGARILFVGIGCPKQERWMHAHLDRVQAVMLGVGAAFDFHSGRVRQAPPWLQRAGMEWFFRMLMEPRRLWRRYARVVPRFLWLAGTQVLAWRLLGRPPLVREEAAQHLPAGDIPGQPVPAT